MGNVILAYEIPVGTRGKPSGVFTLDLRTDRISGITSNVLFPNIETLNYGLPPGNTSVSYVTFREPNQNYARRLLNDALRGVRVDYPSENAVFCEPRSGIGAVRKRLNGLQYRVTRKGWNIGRGKAGREYNRLKEKLEGDSRYKFYAHLLDMPIPMNAATVPEAKELVDAQAALEGDSGFLTTTVNIPALREELFRIYEKYLGIEPAAEEAS